MRTHNKISYRRTHQGALVLSAIIQDGNPYGSYLSEQIYYGYTIKEAKQLFLQEEIGGD